MLTNLRLYYELPVLDGILWLYLGGVGTSDILTVSLEEYLFRLGSFRSFRLASSTFTEKREVTIVLDC